MTLQGQVHTLSTKLALLLCGLLLCASVVHAAPTNRTIRNIKIEVRDVFDEPNLAWFYRGVNSLKIATKQEVIERELLFAPGEAFDKFRIAESERNLRTLPFIRQVSITPIVVGDYVDLLVSVQDTWTLFPQLNFSMGGGKSKQSFGIADSNLLGYGKDLEIFNGENDGRRESLLRWNDRRVFGSRQELDMTHLDRSDGFRTSGVLGTPFRTLVDRRAWNLSYDFADLVNTMYDNGEERFIFREKHMSTDFGYSFLYGEPENVAQRLKFGGIFSSSEFSMADDDDFEDVDLDPERVSRDPQYLASDRQYAGPAVTYTRIEPDFISLNYVDRFERVEDFNLGNSFFAQAWYAAKVLDSDNDSMIFSVSDTDGFRLGPTEFIRAEVGGSSRFHSDQTSNTMLRGEMRYYNVLGSQRLFGQYLGRHTLAAAMFVDYGTDLDLDREYVLGTQRGLRGYKEDAFTGNSRISMHLEDRFHLADDVLKLLNIGGAVFFDAGGTSDHGLSDIIKDNLYSNVGIGLRFGLPRSSSGRVLRVDLAFPLRDGPDGTMKYEPSLVLSLGQVFAAKTTSEQLGAVRANSSLGMTPW